MAGMASARLDYIASPPSVQSLIQSASFYGQGKKEDGHSRLGGYERKLQFSSSFPEGGPSVEMLIQL